MANTSYNIRLDESLKNKAFSVFESYGLTPAQAIKLFLNQVAETNTIPLSFEYHKENIEKIPNQTTLDAIYEACNNDLKRYDNLSDMIKDIENWQEQ